MAERMVWGDSACRVGLVRHPQGLSDCSGGISKAGNTPIAGFRIQKFRDVLVSPYMWFEKETCESTPDGEASIFDTIKVCEPKDPVESGDSSEDEDSSNEDKENHDDEKDDFGTITVEPEQERFVSVPATGPADGIHQDKYSNLNFGIPQQDIWETLAKGIWLEQQRNLLRPGTTVIEIVQERWYFNCWTLSYDVWEGFAKAMSTSLW